MRIVTRPDFDGIVCAVLLAEVLNVQEPIKWVQPNELQSGLVEIRKGDIIANLPYDDRCTLWFDHHYTNQPLRSYSGVFQIAPSAAGLIWAHYKGRFNRDYSELVAATDKIDSADLTLDQVLHPEKYDYVLLSMTICDGDSSDELYWNRLVDLLGKYDIQQVRADFEVMRRCDEVIQQNKQYAIHLKENTRMEKGVTVTDFRNLSDVPVGNRFLVYSLFLEAHVNVKIRYEDEDRETVAVSVGHSIFNPACNVNAGLLLADFGGGGHRGAASTRIPKRKAQGYIPRIIAALQKNENNEK